MADQYKSTGQLSNIYANSRTRGLIKKGYVSAVYAMTGMSETTMRKFKAVHILAKILKAINMAVRQGGVVFDPRSSTKGFSVDGKMSDIKNLYLALAREEAGHNILAKFTRLTATMQNTGVFFKMKDIESVEKIKNIIDVISEKVHSMQEKYSDNKAIKEDISKALKNEL
jgi:hypothetical protein